MNWTTVITGTKESGVENKVSLRGVIAKSVDFKSPFITGLNSKISSWGKQWLCLDFIWKWHTSKNFVVGCYSHAANDDAVRGFDGQLLCVIWRSIYTLVYGLFYSFLFENWKGIKRDEGYYTIISVVCGRLSRKSGKCFSFHPKYNTFIFMSFLLLFRWHYAVKIQFTIIKWVKVMNTFGTLLVYDIVWEWTLLMDSGKS